MSGRVHLCGRLQVEWDGERLEGALPGRQGRLLFAFLTLHRDRLVRRDELVEALWSEEGPPPGGDALLRPPLSRLRSALGAGRLEGRGELAIRFPEDTWVDREAVRDGLRAAARYGGRRRARELGGGAGGAGDRRARAAAGPGGALAGTVPGRAGGAALELLEAVARAGARLGDGELSEAEQAARAAVEARRSASRRVWRCSRCCVGAATWPRRWSPSTSSGFLREELGTSPGRELLALHADLLRAEPAAPRQPRGRARAGAAGAAPAPGPARPGAGRPVGGPRGGARAAARAARPGGRGRAAGSCWSSARAASARRGWSPSWRPACPASTSSTGAATRRRSSRTVRGSTCCGRAWTPWATPSWPRCSGRGERPRPAVAGAAASASRRR